MKLAATHKYTRENLGYYRVSTLLTSWTNQLVICWDYSRNSYIYIELVYRYPWDRHHKIFDGGMRRIQQSPDSEVTFQMLAETYASKHPSMSKGKDSCGHSVPDGMTAGSNWIYNNNSLLDSVFTLHRTFMVTHFVNYLVLALWLITKYNCMWHCCTDIMHSPQISQCVCYFVVYLYVGWLLLGSCSCVLLH